MCLIRSCRHGDDRGVALVMAMGVALIGIMVAAIVVTAVIVASNDSGRDRVRTTEVHSAEGAVDATMAWLETGIPCSGTGPSSSPLAYGSGAQETEVTVNIDYYSVTTTSSGNTSVQLNCDSATGELNGTPNKAVVTATAVGVRPGVGTPPMRAVQTEVTLTPNESSGVSAAIFAGNTLDDSANLRVVSVSGTDADLWLDTGDWTCGGSTGGSGVRVQGSVYIPEGTLTIQKNCEIDGDVWVQGNVSIFRDAVIGGSLTVRTGNLSYGDFTAGGDVRVGGADLGSGTITSATSPVFGPTPTIPNRTSVTLPKLNYDFSKWSPTTDVTPQVTFTEAVGAANFPGGSCAVSSSIKLSTTAPTVYDLRTCGAKGLWMKNGGELKICKDTAIFMNTLTSSSSWNINTCAGTGKHRLWMIVPANGPDGMFGNMDGNRGSVQFDGNIDSFWYAPAGLYLQTHSTFYGQVYGGTPKLQNDGNFNYVRVGFPGVDLTKGTATVEGFKVVLVNKREVVATAP